MSTAPPPSTGWYTLGDVLCEHSLAHPERTATICGGESFSWAELDGRVDRLAGALHRKGVAPGDRVLWLGQNCHRVLELLLAAGRLGAACCPANWRQSPEELAFVIDDLEPRVIVWQDAEIGAAVHKARAAARTADAAAWVQHDDPSGYEAELAVAPPPPEEPVGHDAPATLGQAVDTGRPGVPGSGVDPEAPVLVLYTAAFEGRPNGALLPHRALLAQGVVQTGLGLAGPDDVYLNCGPLFHVGTFKATLATFVAGGTNVFTPRVDAEELCRLIDAHGCTGAFLLPPTVEAMAEINAGRRYDLSTLLAKPGPEAWTAMITVDDRPLPRSGFGQTELAGIVTYSRPGDQGRAGRAAPLTRVEIMGPDGRLLPAGETGEIVVRGPMVMTGYHRRPELTAARSRGGWHHTGDLGHREADASLTFVGPMTRFIKSAAENIYPGEVEACLKTHPAVADAAVIGVPDERWGQSVKAIVVLKGEVGEAELIAHCRDRIASYKKPRTVVFAESLPRRNGVLDYDALDAAYGGGGYPGTGR